MSGRLLAAALLAALALAARADDPAAVDAPDLPPLAQVERALAAYPPVRAARDLVRVEGANAERLAAGPYEFTLRGGYYNHRLPGGSLPEVDMGVERGLRLPEKARLDRALGELGVEFARRAAFSAWCDGARLLLQLWFAWSRERVQLDTWTRQVVFLRQQRDVAARRARVGDAPRMEVNLAEATLGQAEAVVATIAGREAGARAALERTFPGITVPDTVARVDPRPPERDVEWYVERVRRFNDEVGVARAFTRRARLLAQRAAAERVPDPALGARYGVDRSQDDRITGLYFAVPLPGEARRAFSAAELARADAAGSAEAAVIQRVTAEVVTMLGRARGAYAGWERASAAAAGMQRNAELMARSWQLREASLSDVVLARRLAVEASLQAILAQMEADETRYRLLIEAHVLWSDPEHDRKPHED